MIISLHMPKTGGTTFVSVLEQQFGRGLKRDYFDKVINTPLDERIARAILQRKQIDRYGMALNKLRRVHCIHGHFLPYKYAGQADDERNHFITWLRDPIDRLGSHYHYWMRSKGPPNALRRRVVEEGWTLEQFCLSDEIRNLYSQFLWRFPLDRFEFIGIMEHYDEDLAYFAMNYFGQPHDGLPARNVNPNRGGYFDDPGFVRELEQFHSDDCSLYRAALELREARAS